MSRIVFDIETVGVDFDSLDVAQQEYWLRFADSEEDAAAVREKLGLYPLTGEVVALGLLNPDTRKGAVYFQTRDAELAPSTEEDILYEPASEKEILEKFWEVVTRYGEFVTFNGRSFDCPFIIIRSAIHRIKATRELLPNRFLGPHVDLMDRLTFFGATRRRYSLDMWCRAFGIESPKEQGISGRDVKQLFSEGRFLDIARYCGRDLVATADLLEYWEQYVKFTPDQGG